MALTYLDHLERTHFIEELEENDCMHVVQVIEDYLVCEEGLEHTE